jgi:hypothetical protein
LQVDQYSNWLINSNESPVISHAEAQELAKSILESLCNCITNHESPITLNYLPRLPPTPKILIRFLQPIFNRNLMLPSQRMKFRTVKKFSRRSIGFEVSNLSSPVYPYFDKNWSSVTNSFLDKQCQMHY